MELDPFFGHLQAVRGRSRGARWRPIRRAAFLWLARRRAWSISVLCATAKSQRPELALLAIIGLNLAQQLDEDVLDDVTGVALREGPVCAGMRTASAGKWRRTRAIVRDHAGKRRR